MKIKTTLLLLISIFLSLSPLLATPTDDLLDAALKGDLEKAEVAIKAGVDVNLEEEDNNAILVALNNKNIPIVDLILNSKSFLQEKQDIVKNNIFFFKYWDKLYSLTEEDRKSIINKTIQNIKKHPIESEELKNTSNLILWFLYQTEGSNESLQFAEELFGEIENTIFIKQIISKIQEKLNPEIYFYIAMYSSKRMDFLSTDEYLSLVYKQNTILLSKAEKREEFAFYFRTSEHEKKGLPYRLELERKLPKLLIQNGHTGGVTHITFSPDGKRLATASDDKTAKIWDLNGKLLTDLKGHTGYVYRITFSPDGKRLATASDDNTAKIWDLDGKLLADLNGHTSRVNHITFSPDGKRLATASSDNTAKIWDVDGKLLADLKGHTESVNHITFSPDGKKLATASWDNTAKIWDIDGKLLADLKGHTSWVNHITFSPDGKRLATASWDYTAKIWDVDGKLLADLKGHTGHAYHITFSPDGKRLATASGNGKVKIWDLDGKILSDLKGHTDNVNYITFSPDGKRLATASWDNTAKIWDLDGKLLADLKGHASEVYNITFSPDGKRLATASFDSTAKIWDLDGKLLADLKGHANSVNHITISPDGKILATASRDGTAKIWDLDGKLLADLKGHTSEVIHVTFSPNGKRLATASYDYTAKIWDLDGKLLADLKGHTNVVEHINFSPDGTKLATASRDQTAKNWDIDGKLLSDLKGHTESVNHITFSPNGAKLATASNDNTAKIWDLDGKLLADLKGHTGILTHITFSPDGKRLATASRDNTAKIWDLDGRLLADLKGHTDRVWHITFSPDGKILTTSSEDNTIILWKPGSENNPRPWKILEGHTGSITFLQFQNEGKILVSASEDNTIKYWDMNAKKGDSGLLLTQQLFNNGNGLVFTPDGRYDYTKENVKDFVSFKVAGEFIELDDIDDHYRIKGLREKVLSGELKPMDFNHIAKMAEDLPTIKVVYPSGDTSTSKNIQDCKVKIKSKTLKISKVEAWVNGSKTDISKEFAKGIESEYEAEFKFKVNLKQGQNYVKLLAYNEFNLPSSHLIEIKREVKGKAEPVNLYVLSIGVNEYTKNKSKNLKYSEHDAVEFAKVLESQKENGLYKYVFVNRLVSSEKDPKKRPTKSNILAGLEEIRKNASPDDVVVVYYSGHGMSASLGSSNLFYLVPEDFDWSLNPESSVTAKQEGVDAETMGEILSRVKSHKVVLFIDACHSGDILLAARGEDKQESTNSGLKRMANGTGRFIFASSAGDEKSRESKQIGHGLFTYVLLNALGAKKSPHGTADLIKDKEIKLQEIDTYISETFQKQISTLIKSEIQSPVPMRGLGRYQDRSKAIDFPLIKLK